MNNRKKINEELKGLESSLPGDQHQVPFSVPEGYFENLADQLLSRIRTSETSAADEIQMLSPMLAGISRTMPFEVPQGYFNENIEMLPILTGEDQRSAILELVERNTPYEVPYDYFEKLPSSVIAATKPATPVIRAKKSWMKMSVAAVFFGLIIVTGFWFIDKQNPETKTLASQLKNVSTQELDQFIKASSVLNGTETASNTKPSAEVKILLNDVADKELENFLDEMPSEDLYALN